MGVVFATVNACSAVVVCEVAHVDVAVEEGVVAAEEEALEVCDVDRLPGVQGLGMCTACQSRSDPD